MLRTCWGRRPIELCKAVRANHATLATVRLNVKSIPKTFIFEKGCALVRSMVGLTDIED